MPMITTSTRPSVPQNAGSLWMSRTSSFEPAERLVVDREMEDGEEIRLAVLGVDVDLRPLAARHHVLDVERVPAEPGGECERLLLRGRLEMDPGQAVVLELNDPGPRLDLRLPGLRPVATGPDAREARHRYSEGRRSLPRSCSAC
jgi:hypothetical protein